MTTPRKPRPTEGRACTQCQQHKGPEAFTWNMREARLTSRCRECRRANYLGDPVRARERSLAYYHGHVAHVAAQGRRRRVDRPSKALLTAARQRAKARGIPCTITVSDVVVPTFCPVLGIPLVVSALHCSAGSPTLDRINPRLGYVPGNVIVVSFRANTIKNDSTLEELAAVLRFYTALKGDMWSALAVALTAEEQVRTPDDALRAIGAIK